MQANLDIHTLSGLTQAEVDQRHLNEGYNELPAAKKRNFLAIFKEVISEPMFLLLVGGGLLYFVLGDIQEGIMLLGFVVVVIGITFFQEWKTERALDALKDLSSPRAAVIRDGNEMTVSGKDVVRGDLMVISEGGRVAADAILIDSTNLLVDESLLTGESLSVRKRSRFPDEKSENRPGGDDLPYVFSGTMVVRGQGIVEVISIGGNTEIGKIGKALFAIESEDTNLQKETDALVKKLAIFGLSLCGLVVVVFGLTRGDWIQGFLAGIALAMATLPEEFPVVLTIFLALGAWRMSLKNVLTRRVPAIETLGAATVLCTDKTGTLTQNKMTMAELCVGDQFFIIDPKDKAELFPETYHALAEYSVLASQKDPFDPMEKAIRSFGENFLRHTEHLHHDWQLIREYPLSDKLLALSHVWQSPNGHDYVIAAKGSPEAIGDLCHMSREAFQSMEKSVIALSSRGLRVLGVAKSHFSETKLPEEQHDFDFQFIGLIAFIDPIRPTVPAAVKECYTAGIRVVMITGDYPGTAQNIAEQIGLFPRDKVITGPQLSAMSETEMREKIKDVNIFARVVPEQKLHIVNALKANGEIVAMTGDGVNDAPALKAAHIGIAMGKRGTDVARESASLVLLDDDFSSIVAAVRMGRRIFTNIRKAMAYIFAIHVPIAGLSLIPVLLKWPLILMPVHIVFLELIIDPACSVVFEAEPEEKGIMERPPRNPKDRLFSRSMVTLSILQGATVLVITTAIYAIGLYTGAGEVDARTLAFTALVIANVCLILVNRSWDNTILTTIRQPNKSLWILVGGVALFLTLVLNVPFLQKLFLFDSLHLGDFLICAGAAVSSILWFELLKMWHKHTAKKA